jgi:hypothetical protein
MKLPCGCQLLLPFGVWIYCGWHLQTCRVRLVRKGLTG